MTLKAASQSFSKTEIQPEGVDLRKGYCIHERICWNKPKSGNWTILLGHFHTLYDCLLVLLVSDRIFFFKDKNINPITLFILPILCSLLSGLFLDTSILWLYSYATTECLLRARINLFPPYLKLIIKKFLFIHVLLHSLRLIGITFLTFIIVNRIIFSIISFSQGVPRYYSPKVGCRLQGPNMHFNSRPVLFIQGLPQIDSLLPWFTPSKFEHLVETHSSSNCL